MCTFHGCHGRAVTASTRLGSGAWWWARSCAKRLREAYPDWRAAPEDLEEPEEGTSLEDGAVVKIEGEAA